MGVDTWAGTHCVPSTSEAAGAILTWNWVPSMTYSCTYDVIPTDPVVPPCGAVG